MDPKGNWTAKLELSSSLKNVFWRNDAWFVEWITIMGTEHVEFSCQFNVWLEKEVITNKHKIAHKATCNIKGNYGIDAKTFSAYKFQVVPRCMVKILAHFPLTLKDKRSTPASMIPTQNHGA